MPSKSFDTPILIIFFHRADVVAKVIESFRHLTPSRLFLACDGPRPGNDQDSIDVLQAREMVDQLIDWPCSIEKRYSDSNQGTKYGPANAITWFFSHVEEGIILEHDCLPHPSFPTVNPCLVAIDTTPVFGRLAATTMWKIKRQLNLAISSAVTARPGAWPLGAAAGRLMILI